MTSGQPGHCRLVTSQERNATNMKVSSWVEAWKQPLCVCCSSKKAWTRVCDVKLASCIQRFKNSSDVVTILHGSEYIQSCFTKLASKNWWLPFWFDLAQCMPYNFQVVTLNVLDFSCKIFAYRLPYMLDSDFSILSHLYSCCKCLLRHEIDQKWSDVCSPHYPHSSYDSTIVL